MIQIPYQWQQGEGIMHHQGITKGHSFYPIVALHNCRNDDVSDQNGERIDIHGHTMYPWDIVTLSKRICMHGVKPVDACIDVSTIEIF